MWIGLEASSEWNAADRAALFASGGLAALDGAELGEPVVPGDVARPDAFVADGLSVALPLAIATTSKAIAADRGASADDGDEGESRNHLDHVFHDETPSLSRLLDVNGRKIVEQEINVKQKLIFLPSNDRLHTCHPAL